MLQRQRVISDVCQLFGSLSKSKSLFVYLSKWTRGRLSCLEICRDVTKRQAAHYRWALIANSNKRRPCFKVYIFFLVPQLFFIYLFFNWKFSHAAFRGRQSGPSASISVTPTMCMSSFTASIQWKFEHELENKITFIKHYLTWCFHKHPECGRTWMDGKPQHWYNRLPDRNYDALAWKHFIQLCPYILFWGKILAELFNV